MSYNYDDLTLDYDGFIAKIKNGEYFVENSNQFVSDRLKLKNNTPTYSKFIDIVSQLISLTNDARDRKIIFIPYSSYLKSSDITMPIITHKVYRRVPNEPKPRFRETVNDVNNENQVITIKGQRFVYTIDFTVFDSTYDGAEEIMTEFEDLITTYLGYFQEHGVIDIRFVEQISDDLLNVKENIFSKTLRYNVILEKLTFVSEAKFKEIISKIIID